MTSPHDTPVGPDPGPSRNGPATRRRWHGLVPAAGGIAVVAAVTASLVASKGGPSVSADERVETEVPVHVARVTRVTLRRYVEGVGTVAPEPAHDDQPAAAAQIASPVTGVVVAAHCAEGQRVQKGAALFELDARTAVADEQKARAAVALEQAKVARAASELEFEERELERVKHLTAEGLASARDLSEADARAKAARDDVASARAAVDDASRAVIVTGARRSLLTIRAPLSGTVVSVHVNPGEAVDLTTPATVLAEIVDLDRLVVAGTVPAVELPSLEIGQPVELHVAERRDAPGPASAADGGGVTANVPARAYDGRLSFIGFAVDKRTDSVPVRVGFAPELGLRPGQYLRLRIAVDEHAGRLAVPVASVVAGADAGAVVFVLDGDHAVAVPVRVGITENGLTEVEGAGLSEATTVVTAGAYGLPAGTKVRVLAGP